jgi:dolichol-phosphate mannosyltransferase
MKRGKNYSDTTVITPSLNEVHTIGDIVYLVARLYPGIRIFVCDDGSDDGTQEVVRKYAFRNRNVRLIDKSKKIQGLTASVIDGIKNATTEYFVVIDSDLQHPPEKIKAIIAKLREGNDVVVGVRLKIAIKWPFVRKTISKIAVFMGKIRLLNKKFKCNDIMSGFFGAKTKLIQEIIKTRKKKFEPRGYKVLFDILKQLPNDAKIGEVPYTFDIRKKGSSKMRLKHIIVYFKSLFK